LKTLSLRRRRPHSAWTERSEVNPSRSAILRFRAESYEWQAMKKQLDAKKGESAPKVWDLISDLNNTLGASIVIAYV
jgi:hypothetical protein